MRFFSRRRVKLMMAAGLTGVAYLGSQAAYADPATIATDAADDQPLRTQFEPTFTTGLFSSSRATLLGDAFGLRTALGRYGVTVAVTETSEVFGNVSGGTRQGADYIGLTTGTMQVDTLKAFGLAGGLVNVSAFQIHGTSLSTKNLGGVLQTVSGIQASRATRLWEAWYQQTFLDGKFDVKVGQQSADQEFITSTGSSLFINTMMGWPAGAVLRPICRRPGLPSVVARGTPTRTDHAQADGVARSLQRQPTWRVLQRCVADARHRGGGATLQSEHRGARLRRAPICGEPACRR